MEMKAPSISRLSGSMSIDGLISKARKLVEQEQYDEALALFEQALALDPSSKQAHLGAGKLKHKQKRYEEAVSHFEECIRLEPTKERPYILAARAAAAMNKLDLALEHIQNSIKLNPKVAVAYAGTGVIFQKLGKTADAEKNLLMALQLNPRMVDSRQKLAQLYAEQKKIPEAIYQLNAALRVAPLNAESYKGLGYVYLQEHDWTPARDAFRQAIQIETEAPSAKALLGLAESCIESDLLTEAEEALQKVPDKEQSKARLHKLWGDMYTKKDMKKEALEEYRAAELLAAEERNAPQPDEGLTLPGENEAAEWEQLLGTARESANRELANKRARARKASR